MHHKTWNDEKEISSFRLPDEELLSRVQHFSNARLMDGKKGSALRISKVVDKIIQLCEQFFGGF